MYNNYFTFQPDLTKAMPILKDALVLTNDLDPHAIQDVICQELLPAPFSMLGTDVRLQLCTVIISHDIAHWDLIFYCPAKDKCLNLCKTIHENSIGLDDSFDHYTAYGNNIYKISFKVG
jgi:hypothetical protein